MAKRKEWLVIGDETFTVSHASVNDFKVRNCFRELYMCYDRPSDAKKYIYGEWEDFFRTCNTDVLPYCYGSGVISYNCMMFTYGADCDIIYEGEYRRASFYITKTRNEVTIYDL